MKCENFLQFIDAYVDSEFDDLESDELEMHLSACPSCREKVDNQTNWKRNLKECLSEESVPTDLRASILSQIMRSDESALDIHPEKVIPFQKKGFPKSAIVAFSFAAVALLSFYTIPKIVTVAPASSDTQPVIEQAIDWHRGNFPIEVTGPESQRVESWFGDKVAFPIHLPAFEDANLLGGRLANLKERRAAYVTYDLNGKRLSLMLFNGEGLLVPANNIKHIEGRDIAMVQRDGYTVALVQNGGVTYAITSDISEKDMIKVVSSFSAKK